MTQETRRPVGYAGERSWAKALLKGCKQANLMGSAKGDFPNYEIGPNVARVMRNAHCDVLIVRG